MGYDTSNKIIIRGKSEEVKSLGEKITTWLSESEGKNDENWVGYIGNAAFSDDEDYDWSDIGFVYGLEITDSGLIIDEDTKYGAELDLWYSLCQKYLSEYELDYVSRWGGDDVIDTNVKDFKGKKLITNLDTNKTYGDYKVENNHFVYCAYDELEVALDNWDEEGIEYEVIKYELPDEEEDSCEEEVEESLHKTGIDLKNCSDQEIIDECFRRMYSDDSEILAVKIWTLEDLIYKAGEWCTKKDAKKIAKGLSIDALTDCSDSEWKTIEKAIKKYKKQ